MIPLSDIMSRAVVKTFIYVDTKDHARGLSNEFLQWSKIMAASPCKSIGKCLHAKYILISSQTLKCLRARRPRALHLNLTCDV